jgi:hypothetical protein
MATKISTGLAGYLLGQGCLRQALGSSVIRVYSGVEPLQADSAIGGTLLAEFSVDGAGGGLNLAAASVGALISKSELEAWRSAAVNTGTASWFRWCLPSDAGTYSTSALRVQGAVSMVGAELNFSSVAFVQGAIQKVDYFAIAMPAN